MSATEPTLTSFEPGAAAPTGGIPLCVPEIRGNAWAYVKECLDGGWVSSVGPFVERFERELAARVGARHAVAVVNGTAALQVALQLVGVERDDEVLVPALTFIAPVNAVRYLGAYPVVLDVTPEDWQLDPAKLRDFLLRECERVHGVLRNRTSGRRVRAILPVHILGNSVDLDAVLSLGAEFDLPVVEDCAEALGTIYRGRQVGGRSRVGCFSFNGNKVITTGGGGMLVTDDEALAKRARYLTTQAKDDPIEYVHNEVGYNHRLTSMQAALGCAQLEDLDAFVEAKRSNAQRYARALTGLQGITPMPESAHTRSAFWLYTVLVDESTCATSSRDLLRRLAANKIQARPLWQPMHRSRAQDGVQAYRVEVADVIHQQALSLPSSVGLKEEELGRVVEVIRSAVRE